MVILFPRVFHQVQQEELAACRVRAHRAPCGHGRVVPEVMVEGDPHVPQQGEIGTTANLVNGQLPAPWSQTWTSSSQSVALRDVTFLGSCSCAGSQQSVHKPLVPWPSLNSANHNTFPQTNRTFLLSVSVKSRCLAFPWADWLTGEKREC